MTAQQIDAQPLRLQHHVAHESFRGGTVYGLWIEILIERRHHVERLAIQIELSINRFEGSKTEAGSAHVLHRSREARFYRVERWMFRRPQPRVRDSSLNTVRGLCG